MLAEQAFGVGTGDAGPENGLAGDLVEGDELAVILDDTPTARYGPCIDGAGIHHNPTPGPAGERLVYGHVWVALALLTWDALRTAHRSARALAAASVPRPVPAVAETPTSQV